MGTTLKPVKIILYYRDLKSCDSLAQTTDVSWEPL